MTKVERFRKEWGDTFPIDKYPDWLVEMALCEADRETGGSGWGSYSERCNNDKWKGMKLFGAHWLSIFYGTGLTPDGQLNVPIEARLNVQGKSVGDESTQYRVAAMMDAGNDWLTYTIFGQQFYQFRRRIGMGARVAVIPIRAGHFH